MMGAQIDVAKLAKILGMLGSDHDGERAAAALKADHFVRQAGLTWETILKSGHAPKPHRPPEFGTWRQTCRECLARDRDLRQWERGFLNDLPKFQRISTKQRYCLNEIAIRLGIRERTA
jgi:hypothetical protein